MAHDEWIAAINKRFGEMVDGDDGDVIALVTLAVEGASPCALDRAEARKIAEAVLQSYHRWLEKIEFAVGPDPDARKKANEFRRKAQDLDLERHAERARRDGAAHT